MFVILESRIFEKTDHTKKNGNRKRVEASLKIRVGKKTSMVATDGKDKAEVYFAALLKNLADFFPMLANIKMRRGIDFGHTSYVEFECANRVISSRAASLDEALEEGFRICLRGLTQDEWPRQGEDIEVNSVTGDEFFDLSQPIDESFEEASQL